MNTKKFAEIINRKNKSKTSAYDTKAVVRRVEDGIAWVHISGGVDETPVELGVNASKGDVVQVRVANGRAWVVGNMTSPPTDDKRAEYAISEAMYASNKANSALNEAIFAQDEANRLATDMAETVLRIDGDIENLQDQVDGNITSWFYPYEPSVGNYPASSWSTVAEKDNHLGDLFYNTVTGYAYRFMKDGNTYSWAKITDSDVTEALRIAAEAQDTADSKRRVFFNTPVPPYDRGDLWVQGSNGDILRCNTAKATGGSFAQSDWVLASKYTDDTRANEAYQLASTAKASADGKNTIYRQNTQPTGGTYVAGDVWFDTAHNNKIYRHNGTSWQAVLLGDDALDTFSANHITAGTIDASQVTVSNLDAGNITTGNLDADRMKSKVVSAINATLDKINARNINVDGDLIVGKTYTDGAISDAVNDIEIGGRNLLLKTAQSAVFNKAVTAGSYAVADFYDMISAYSALGLTTDDYVTVSFDWSVTGVPSGTVTAKCGTNVSPWEFFGLLTTFSAGSSSGHVEKTFKVTSALASSTGSKLRVRVDSSVAITAGAMVLTITNAKLEKGNKATDWSPAPEDAISAINAVSSASISETVSVYYRSTTHSAPSISSSTSIGTATNTDNAWEYIMPVPKRDRYFYTCEKYVYGDGSISFSTVRELQSETYASKWVHASDSTYIDGGRLYAHSVTADQIKGNSLTIGEINTSDADTSAGLLNSSIDVGGRNLLIGSGADLASKIGTYGSSTFTATRQVAVSEWAAKDATTISGTGGTNAIVALAYGNARYVAQSPMTQIIGETYSFSIYVKNNHATKAINIRPNGSASVGTTANKTVNAGEAKLLTWTWTAAAASNIQINIATPSAGDAFNVTLWHPMYVVGNKSADWSPAPEDAENALLEQSTNMLLDADAPSVGKIKANYDRYFSDAGNSSYIACSIVPISDPPEPSIKYAYRAVGNGTNTSAVSRALAFNSATNTTEIPFKVGTEYTVSVWGRKTSGSASVTVGHRYKATNNRTVVPVTALTSEWKLYTGTIRLESMPTDYNRIWFYVQFAANTAGTAELCGFKVTAGASASTYITKIDDAGIFISPINQSPTTSAAGNSVRIDGNGMKVYKGGTAVAQYGESAIIGKEGESHIVIDAKGQRFYASNGSTLLANIGYDTGAEESITTTVPYYAFGARSSGTIGSRSFSVGMGLLASRPNQVAFGKYNVNNSDNAFEFGNGTGTANRRNIFEIDWSGNVSAARSLIPATWFNKAYTQNVSSLAGNTYLGLSIALPNVSTVNYKRPIFNGFDISGTGTSNIHTLGHYVYLVEDSTNQYAAYVKMRNGSSSAITNFTVTVYITWI